MLLTNNKEASQMIDELLKSKIVFNFVFKIIKKINFLSSITLLLSQL
jgi:hypothetical protein